MKLFECGNCGNTLYFENTHCGKCHGRVGYLGDEATLLGLSPTQESNVWHAYNDVNRLFRFCSNAQYDSCNWLVPANESEFCQACRHNQTIPDLSIPGNLDRWRKYELAKHRLFYTLIGLRLPLPTRDEDPKEGLAFAFLAETPDKPKIITGHDHGLITLNLKEADDVERAKERQRLNEPYRTLLGHLRHESGHYVWIRLIIGPMLQGFRKTFGDEREDYAEALSRHYANGPSPDWGSGFISAYATSHPWEDFAETWAHYLHIMDTLEMAASFRGGPQMPATFEKIIAEWLSLTIYMNSLNRCMGESDLYPFMLPTAVLSKLEFIHKLIAPAQAAAKPKLQLPLRPDCLNSKLPSDSSPEAH